MTVEKWLAPKPSGVAGLRLPRGLIERIRAVIFVLILVSGIVAALLMLTTFVQLLYLESMRLRGRDLPSMRFFKDTLEDRIAVKIEERCGRLLVPEAHPAGAARLCSTSPDLRAARMGLAVFLEAAFSAWLTMLVLGYLLPQLLYRRTRGRWLLPLVPLFSALWRSRLNLSWPP